MSLPRTLRLAFWLALLVALVMASLPKPPALPGDPSDKVQHILGFILLSVMAVAAYPRTRLILVGLRLSAFGALIEFVQMIPVLNRSSEFMDWVADTAAVAVVLSLVALYRRSRRTA